MVIVWFFTICSNLFVTAQNKIAYLVCQFFLLRIFGRLLLTFSSINYVSWVAFQTIITAQKSSFPFRIFLVNATKSAGNSEINYFHMRIIFKKLHIKKCIKNYFHFIYYLKVKLF